MYREEIFTFHLPLHHIRSDRPSYRWVLSKLPLIIHLGGYRDDQTYVSDTRQAFIVMDGEKRIVGWELTRSESHGDARKCLERMKSRVASADLLYVVVDNCCKVSFLTDIVDFPHFS